MPPARVWRGRLGGPSTDFTYLRFLGDHKAIEKITRTWNQTVIDRTPEIEAWAPLVRELRAQGVDVFGYFNNHFSGHAPEAVELFREVWKRTDHERMEP